jgi:hypothetical protein
LLLLSPAWAKPRRDQAPEIEMPLRLVVQSGGQWLSNCIFSKQPIPARASHDTPLTAAFSDGDSMFARCYLPERAGSNKPGDLVDVLYLDGKKWWTQAYDEAVPSDALERPVVLSEILRSVRGSIPKGDHLIKIEGFLVKGKRRVKLYRGEFRYLR